MRRRIHCDQDWCRYTAPLQSTYGVEEIAKGGRCSVASQLGKRYRCKVCGTEVLCVKAGEG
ncbi:MAG: hypothetical protein MUO99_04630, partial [Dehalococcoidales bacterium]|nr:hypothetical protein [Dehalococcoidales bacterium]